MQFVVDTSTHRSAFAERRLLFSWASFYAGVGVALSMMLVVYKLVPRAEAPNVEHAKAVVVEQPACPVESATAISTMSAGALVGAIESTVPNREYSAALERLRARATAPVDAIDREYAALGIMERTGKNHDDAARMVDTLTCPSH